MEAARKARREAEDESKSLGEELSKLAAQKKKVTTQRANALAHKTKVELQWKEDQERVGADKETRSQAQVELKTLDKKISEAKAELAKIGPDFESMPTA